MTPTWSEIRAPWITRLSSSRLRISRYSRDIWGHNIAGIKRNSWDRMKMDDCAEYHASANVPAGSVQTQKDGCFVCHK